MRVLSWVQTRIHGPHCSGKKPEFQYGSAPPVDRSSSVGPRRDEVDELHDGCMLSIGTLGIQQGRRDELERMQEELTLLVTAKAVATTMAEEDEEDKKRHLRHRSFRKLVPDVLSGFLPGLSFRGTTPELRPTEIPPWPLPHHEMPAEDLVMSEATINSYRTAHLPWRGNAMEAEQGSKWIRTDSEYIVLEI